MLKCRILGDTLIMTESLRRKAWGKGEGGTWERSKGGTITSDRLIIDSDGHLGVFHFKFVRINIPIAEREGGQRSDLFQEQNELCWWKDDMITVMSGMTVPNYSLSISSYQC